MDVINRLCSNNVIHCNYVTMNIINDLCHLITGCTCMHILYCGLIIL